MSKGNNKGYSLVELIIVIGILSVLGGVSFSLLGSLPSGEVKTSANKLEILIGKARTSALSFKDARLELEKTTDGVYVTITAQKIVTSGGSVPVVSDAQERVKLGGSQLEVVLIPSTASGLSNVTLGVGQRMVLTFDRSSGAFVARGMATGTGSASGEYEKIQLKRSSYSRTLKLEKLTGKVVME